MSFMMPMKDIKPPEVERNVLHEADEGQKAPGERTKCPSWCRWRTKSPRRESEMSFMKPMKDKKGPEGEQNVLHNADEGQKVSGERAKCPSWSRWRTKSARRESKMPFMKPKRDKSQRKWVGRNPLLPPDISLFTRITSKRLPLLNNQILKVKSLVNWSLHSINQTFD